jgi:chemotaxis protein methyltransferase CheR
VSDGDCVDLLRWALPQLGLRWAGFRGLHHQVCKRIARRRAELGTPDLTSYRRRLERDPAEWELFRRMCIVTISRFYRDREVWAALREDVLPALAERALRAGGDPEVRCWSAGCASGEEPYTLALVWRLDVGVRYPAVRLRVLGTELDERLLARARVGEYRPSSVKELPPGWVERAFEPRRGAVRLRRELRDDVELRQGDLRAAVPEGPFDLISCRNVVFTYFDEGSQRATLARLLGVLSDGGALVVGKGESIPAAQALAPWHAEVGIVRRLPAPGGPLLRTPRGAGGSQ